ncbi:MAG: DNA cytosine methyltransferase, partial [Candidatus Korarchaeota archaeon]|nr:DNA cytosine methyltransferase [Candidatus Korarchaeota archaeon]NIW12893.1 DNA cytosine methyltransferase [Candidatus Thorarchaeota archaeon]NIW51085.1 DNA cytosine methyltransferase [Candidatus Korarchaeota archaeon]
KDRPKNGGPPLTPKERKGSVVKLFVNDLMDISGADYRVDIFETNAVNYGAPQIRERVFFIGNRYG